MSNRTDSGFVSLGVARTCPIHHQIKAIKIMEILLQSLELSTGHGSGGSQKSRNKIPSKVITLLLATVSERRAPPIHARTRLAQSWPGMNRGSLSLRNCRQKYYFRTGLVSSATVHVKKLYYWIYFLTIRTSY